MDRRHQPDLPLLWMTLVAGLMAMPLLALAQGQPADVAPSPQVGAPPAAPSMAATGAVLTPGAALLSQPRLSRILRSRVYNDRDEAIGDVEEVLLAPPNTPATPSALGPVAILQVGGFLGLGGRLVSVPLGDLRWNAARERVTMPSATREALRVRPAFDYGMLRNP